MYMLFEKSGKHLDTGVKSISKLARNAKSIQIPLEISTF